MKPVQTKDHLLLVDEKAEIKGDNCHTNKGLLHSIDGDGYHIIDYKNIDKTYYSKSTIQRAIGYYPLTKEAKELDLPLLPNPFEDNINKEFNSQYKNFVFDDIWEETLIKTAFRKGYKAAQSDKQ